MTAANHYRSEVLKTPFHGRAVAHMRSNEWSRWSGFATVSRFHAADLEYFAIRNTATVFDLSPMIKYRIAGPDALAYADRLVTRNLGKLAPGRVAYAVWCDDAGKVLDDGTLFRLGETEFRLCCQERHLPWLLDSALGYDIEIAEVSDRIAALALQGPTSCAVLKRFGLDDIAQLKPFHLRQVPFEGGTLMVSRTGFTGDLGYELWVDTAQAENLWDRLMEAGKLHGIEPIGGEALNLARIEAGFIQTNTDFLAADQVLRPNRGRTPYELGLDWLVDLDKGQFNGRRALLRARAEGPRSRIVGLEIEGNKPAHQALIYHGKTKSAGFVTSAMWSPTCKRNIAIATLSAPYGINVTDDLWVEIYVNKELKWEKSMLRCWIVDRPFFNPPRRTATPAHDF